MALAFGLGEDVAALRKNFVDPGPVLQEVGSKKFNRLLVPGRAD